MSNWLDALAERYDDSSGYGTNIPKWIYDKLGEHTTQQQRDLCQSLIENRYTAVHSCHDAGKAT